MVHKTPGDNLPLRASERSSNLRVRVGVRVRVRVKVWVSGCNLDRKHEHGRL